MRIIYFDTSTLVKRYTQERGTQIVADLLLSGEMFITSILAYPEMKAAFAKKLRLREIIGESHKRAIESFHKDWNIPIFSIIGLSPEIAYLAGAMAEKKSLRALDAIHLASALIAKESFRFPVVFVSADGQLNRAVTSEGLDFINPEKV